MKVKYKKRLVQRAEHNAKEDIEFVGDRFIDKKSHIELTAQPEKPFYACAVGCLVLPTKAEERKAFLRRRGGRHYHQILEEEFNLPGWLLEEAEEFFTDLDDECHEKMYSAKKRTRILGDFVISFAKAIPEGFNFDSFLGNETGTTTRKNFLEWLRRRDKSKTLATA